MEEMNSVSTAKKTYNGIGVGLTIILVLSLILSVMIGIVTSILARTGFDLEKNDWYMWVASFAPLYLIAIPAGYAFIKRYPGDEAGKTRLGAKNYFKLLIMSVTFLYVGNIIGTVLSFVLTGGDAVNPLNDLAFDQSILKVLVMAVLAPMIEEFIFRKSIIDRCSRYGEKKAIFFSALAFGLFHMNFFQFFYAFGLGLVFGYIYTRTRNIWYSISMHMIINFMGGTVAPFLVSISDSSLLEMDMAEIASMPDAQLIPMLSSMIPLIIYAIILIALSVVGLVLIIMNIRKLVFLKKAEEIPKGSGFSTIYLNVGVILFVVGCLVMFAVNLYN